MPVYEAENPQGQTIEFDWNAPNPPTDADIQEIFSAAAQQQQQSPQTKTDIPSFRAPKPGSEKDPILRHSEEIPEIPIRDVAAGIFRNFGKDAKTVGSSFWAALTNPVESAKVLGGLAKGALELAVPAAEAPTSPEQLRVGVQSKHEKLALAFGDFMKERYGSVEKFKVSLRDTPVQTAADLSVFFTGAAGALPKVEQLNTVANILKTVGHVTDPINAAKMIIRLPMTLTAKAFPGISKKLYESSLKLSPKLSVSARSSIVQKGLKEGFIPTEKSLARLQEKITGIVKEVDGQVLDATYRGQIVSTGEVVNALDDLETFFRKTTTPKEYLASITKIKEAFLEAHGKALTPQMAQEIKRNTHTLLQRSYGQLSDVVKETNKALARGLRIELEKLHPELGRLNKEASELIKLDNALNSAVGQISKREIFNTRETFAMAAAVSADTARRQSLTGFILLDKILTSPTLKTRLAVALKKAEKLAPRQRLIPAGNIAFQTGRIQQEVEK